MNVQELVLEAQRAGLTVRVEGDVLVVRGPNSAEALARRLLECKPDVLALLQPPPAPEPCDRLEAPPAVTPPPGAKLYFQDERFRICGPADAYLWCWEGGGRWYYPAEHAVPECQA